MRILVVRLSALGDLVHTLPAVAALRRGLPDAEIDWVVDERFRELLDLVPVINNTYTLSRSGVRAWSGLWRTAKLLRRRQYDIAIDAQGLLKSAMVARLSGARRVIGFDDADLREPAAQWLYSESVGVSDATHVVEKNLALIEPLVGQPDTWEFPIDTRSSEALMSTLAELRLDDGDDFALLHPGTAWPSKCWDPVRYGALAKRLRADHQLKSAVIWGPGDQSRARAVVTASDGAATLTSATGIGDMVAHARAAAVVIAGDTGPLHVAAAVGTPVVGIYGPSDPERNGPWSDLDQVVSAGDSCRCRLDRQGQGTRGVVVRRCSQPRPCLDGISVEELFQSVEHRLKLAATHG